MGTIRIEYVPIQKYGLGLFGLDHIQLVYQDETDVIDSQDYWFVLEGILEGSAFNGTLGALGEDAHTSLASANGASRDDLIAKIGTPDDRGSRIIKTGSDAFGLWTTMANYGGGIQEMDLPYIGASWPFSPQPTINSTSFIASVLYSIGVDIHNLLPFGIRNAPGASTLIGTAEADDMRTTQEFNQLVTGQGEDSLRGTSNRIYIEKFYGGEDNDTFYWSPGENILHGGQPRLAYANDGLDTVDYSGVGAVHIYSTKHAVEHKVANYIAVFENGSDQLFSIEAAAWDRSNDRITAGEGVEFLEKPLLLDLQGNSGGQGDILGFGDGDRDLIINAVDDTTVSVQALSSLGEDAGYWAQSVEWLAGGGGDDLIYTNASVLGAEGDAGDDTLDGRLSEMFSGGSPEGYDIELYGGEGDDTLVSGSGRTLANGGADSDTFVLSAMGSGLGAVEFVIDDADADDKLYVPYDFFKIARGDYEGSQLFQLTGAPFKIDDIITESLFQWGLPDDDQVHGDIEFVGYLSYKMEGSDLVLSLYQGHVETEIVDNGPGEPPGPTLTLSVGELDTLATIRVRDWSEGVLGITFPLTWDSALFDTLENGFADYPGYQSAITDDTDASHFIAPLDERPEAHLPAEFASSGAVSARAAFAPVTIGTEGNDTLAALTGGPYHFDGKGGDDDITGSGNGDTLDGGTGSDTLRGGRGNDTYFVDSAGDVVVEDARAGFDRVISAINYTLGDNVENLVLGGAALTATGNALRNTLEGNDLDNTLTGHDGDDTLAGNLGDDTLIGGAGGDGYVYENGDGRDIIIEDAGGSLDDVLILAGTLTPGDITFIRDPGAMADLILSLKDGGRITIRNYFDANGPGLEAIEFTTGTEWSGSDLATRAAAAIVTSNDAPVATDDKLATTLSGPIVIPVAALLDNDRDADGDALALLSVSNASGGTAVIDGNGNVVVTPGAQAGNGFLTFDYTIGDGNGGTAQATFELSLYKNSAPSIVSATLGAALEDTIATGLITAQDADGDLLVYSVKADARPLKGAVTVSSDGTINYTPQANANGADQFTLLVTDGHSAPVEQVFNFNIAAVNDAPVATDDKLTTRLSGPIVIPVAALLDNDRDTDGDTLALLSVSNAVGGTAVIDGNGNVLVTPGAQTGNSVVTFDYVITDGNGGNSQAAFELSEYGNVAPTILTATLGAALEDMIATGRITAQDADGDTLIYSVKADAGPLKGAVTVSSDGTINYTPQANANGADQFTLLVTDGQSAPVELIFNFNIAAVNDAPVAGADTGFTVKTGKALKIAATELTRNDSDIDGDLLTIASVSNAVGGTVTLDAAGNVDFKAAKGFSGTASFQYVEMDGNGGTSSAQVAIKVTDDNDRNKIVGTSGRDTLYGTAGNDVFTGKRGSDTFVFTPAGGRDIITDFQLGDHRHGAKEVIDLRGNGIASYAQLWSMIRQVGDDTVITLDSHTSIKLEDVRAAHLMHDNFKII